MIYQKYRNLRSKAIGYLDELSLEILELDKKYLKALSDSDLLNRYSRLLILFTYFGDGYLWGIIGLSLIIFGGTQDQNYVLLGLAIAIIDITAFRLVKMVVERPRPVILVKNRPKLKFRLVDAFAFPSGHATMAFSISYLIAQFYPNFWAPAGAYLASVLIGLSRVYVTEHFPLDIVGGAILGTAVSIGFTPLFYHLIF